MRTVAGHTDRVVVVGAGLSGLAAALHLTGAGRSVTLLERADHPGGRVGYYRGPDYEIDSGATVLTLPGLVSEALAAVGSDAAACDLRIRPVDPSYRARFADGTIIGVHADPEVMAAEVRRTCGADEAGRYLELRRWLARIYAAAYGEFMDTNFDSPLDMVRIPAKRAALRDLVRLGAFGRLGPRVRRVLRDPKLARLFTFQALYAGTAPAQALAVYGAIPHMDTSLGVYFPVGGMRAVTAALAAAFTRAGGRLELNCEVAGIEYRDGRARSVRAADGREFDCDAVVLTADLGSLDRFGIHRRRPLRASPSAVVAHGTVPAEVAARWPVQAHHTIDFGQEWDRTFRELAARRGRGRLMSDPSLLLTRPALSDPGQFVERATGTHEPLSLLAPCPNLRAAPLDWPRLGPAYLRELLNVLEARGYRGIAEHFTVDYLDTPRTWHDRGMIAGSPFSAAHLFRQTGPFRTRNLGRFPANVVLAGCGTTPGVGVPTALLSGKLAAERVTGPLRHVAGATAPTGALGLPATH
ncbi:phytoene dehydrogenase [Nocardia nova SH22a]|uniref:Phytoene dehydrogenase n=1 Tax=Nocardia nova SH22a TaxID=1415166 RepID=W5TD93_9NOCA|nr:phytoene desaturase family protein [Nocardia nova]AHH17144.1 phytoene dehydrogenase [Nocardia nova SH22a]